MLEKVGWTVDYLFDGQRPELLGQRVFLFEAEPDGLHTFIKEHRNRVLKDIGALESVATASKLGTPCVMTWAISPILPQG